MKRLNSKARSINHAQYFSKLLDHCTSKIGKVVNSKALSDHVRISDFLPSGEHTHFLIRQLTQYKNRKRNPKWSSTGNSSCGSKKERNIKEREDERTETKKERPEKPRKWKGERKRKVNQTRRTGVKRKQKGKGRRKV
jgi:hypothetical protein